MRPDKQEIIEMLSLTDKSQIEALYKKAYEVKKQYVGTKVYFRGIVELSNICSKNCYYCVIRSGNTKTALYDLVRKRCCRGKMVSRATLWLHCVAGGEQK